MIETAAGSGVARRGFLKKGLVGGALLLVGAAVGVAARSTRMGQGRPPGRRPLALLSPEEYAVLAAVAARVVPGDGADARWPSADAVDCAGKVDAVLALNHPDAGRDFKRLLGLFENGLGGLLVTLRPTPFTALDAAAQDRRLEAWRHSRITVLRSGYQAMVRLTKAAYYASPEVHALMGYPGPPTVPA